MACTHNSRLYWSLEGWTSCPCGEAGCLTHFPINPDIYKNCTDSCFPDPTQASRISETLTADISSSSGSADIFLYYILPVLSFLILVGISVLIYKTLKRCQNNQAHTPRMTLGALLTPEHHTTTDPELGRQAVETRVPVCMPPSSSRSAIEHSDHPRHHGGSASQDLNKVGNEGQEQIDLLSDASHDEE